MRSKEKGFLDFSQKLATVFTISLVLVLYCGWNSRSQIVLQFLVLPWRGDYGW